MSPGEPCQWIPELTMPRTKKSSPAPQLGLLEANVPTAPCVPKIREAVTAWRNSGYKGITDTTSILLNYWFLTDHRPGGRFFRYHDSQRQAIETLIYLWEVAGVRRQKDLLETFAPQIPNLRLLQHDLFARYCVKMATGSGKTKVMALAFAWQYFNAAAGGGPDYASTALVIAPNVIVFERLRTDFGGGRIFKTDPIIPPELKIYWDVDFYVRGDPERAQSLGALYLTNVDQLHLDDPSVESDEPDAIAALLGPKPPANLNEIEDFEKRLVKRGGPLLLLNDEAHHTHDEESAWNQVIRRIHGNVRNGLAAQLDFTATPRHGKTGSLFAWTVSDYPLKQAIIDSLVKRPVKGITTGIHEISSNVASTRYKAYLTAGVNRWKEYREQLEALGKKPILFVMLNDTSEADDVADYLQKTYPSEFGGNKLLTIHTNRSGEIAKGDLDKARQAARDVDLPTSPVNAIVSVLMLREGWDVQNVTVIVGLRPYTSKANILPEQTIGRGLRLMFRNTTIGYTERVDVIGNKKFIEFVEDLEKQEGLELETFTVGKDKLTILTIQPDPDKSSMDIVMPSLTPLLARKSRLADEITALKVSKLPLTNLLRKGDGRPAEKFAYEGYDFISLEKLVEREYTLPEVQTAQEVISYYAKRIAQEVRLPSQFAALAPKVREFLATRAFGETVDIESPDMLRAISANTAQFVTVKAFVTALQPLLVEALTPILENPGRPLSQTEPFPWSRPSYAAPKCIYNLVPCDNEFEKEFARFLQSANDVACFAKLPDSFNFAIQYTDNVGNLRYYYPDFVAVLDDGRHYLVETKGQETPEVAFKDRAARNWASSATSLTGTSWAYLKVPQAEYKNLQPNEFSDLFVFQSGLFTTPDSED